MSQEIIKEVMTITSDEKKARKTIYEELLARGVMHPGSEAIFHKVIDNALDNELIPPNRIKMYRKARGKLPTIFTTEQISLIFENCRRPKLSIVMWMGLFCGFRIREVCNLKISDINIDRRRIFVRDSKNPNREKQGYGKDRIVTIPQIAISPISKWLEITKGGEWFVPSMQDPNRPIRTKTIHEQYRFLLNSVGLSEKEYERHFTQINHGKKKEMSKSIYKYRFHTLRHTYATYLLEKGVPLENIQRSLGHRDLDTTLIYARISDKKTSQLVDDAFSKPLALVNKESILNERQTMGAQQNTYNTLNAVAIKNTSETPMQILQRRLAMGEIDLATFEHLSCRLNLC
jgi:integrase